LSTPTNELSLKGRQSSFRPVNPTMNRRATVSQSLWEALRSRLTPTAALELQFLHYDSGIVCAGFALNYPEECKGWRSLAKKDAVSALVPCISTMQARGSAETHASVPNIEIASDSLGRPYLVINGSGGPTVSFAYVRDTMWVAISLNESNIGVDAEESDSFQGNYPFHRVFHKKELESGGDKDDLAALMWSAKEAVVKALGCGFHLVDPLHVRVEPYCGDHEGLWLRARLTKGTRENLRVQIQDPIPVRVLRYRGIWISVASLR
jgi:phosphopantetheinyl transferase